MQLCTPFRGVIECGDAGEFECELVEGASGIGAWA